MKAVLSLGLAVFLLVSNTALSLDLSTIIHFREEITTPLDVVERLERTEFEATPAGNIDLGVSEIINLGLQVWKIIEKNKPEVKISYRYANALPNGIKSNEELEHFSPLQHQSFRISGKNLFGMTVYEIVYTLVHRFGGTYRETGAYLDAVTVLPSKVEVAWGYNVNMEVKQASIANVGTEGWPIASLGMELALDISTKVKHSRTTELYEFRGDSPNAQLVN